MVSPSDRSGPDPHRAIFTRFAALLAPVCPRVRVDRINRADYGAPRPGQHVRGSLLPEKEAVMSAEPLSGAEIVIRALVDQGVEVVFGYPGGAVLPIYDALFKQNALRHILVRHEQGAVHAAEGYARSPGRVGVVLVTSG